MLLHPQLLEDRLQQSAASKVADALVERLRVQHDLQCRLDQLGADREIKCDAIELFPDLPPRQLNVVEPSADLGTCRSVALRCQIEQVVLLRVEPNELSTELLVQQPRGAALIGDRLLDSLSGFDDEVSAELDLGQIFGDVPLDVIEGQVTLGTGAILQAGAEEVEVLAATTPDVASEQQTTLSALVVAAAAPEQALQEVIVDSVPFASDTSSSKDALDLIEDCLIDERLVPTPILLALVGQQPEVVAIRQHLGDLGLRHRLRRPAGRLTGAQSTVGQLIGEPFERVVARGVQLEGESDEWGPFRVDGHRADLPTLEVLADVEVAEWRPTEGAASFGLLAHLVPDVGAVLGRAELVERGQDAVHQLADRRLVDALGGGHQLHAVFAQLSDCQSIIEPVAVHTAQLVNHDDVNVPLRADAVQHGLEGGALVHARP